MSEESLQKILEINKKIEDTFEMEKRRRKSRNQQEEIDRLTGGRASATILKPKAG